MSRSAGRSPSGNASTRSAAGEAAYDAMDEQLRLRAWNPAAVVDASGPITLVPDNLCEKFPSRPLCMLSDAKV